MIYKGDTLKSKSKTYLMWSKSFVRFLYGTDRKKLDELIFEIIKDRASDNYDTFIASFPFFNRKNSVVYNLI